MIINCYFIYYKQMEADNQVYA